MTIENDNDAISIKIDNLNANFLDFRNEMRAHMSESKKEQKELRMEVDAKTQFIGIEVDNIKTKESECKMTMMKTIADKLDKPHWTSKLYSVIGAQWTAILALLAIIVSLMMRKG